MLLLWGTDMSLYFNAPSLGFFDDQINEVIPAGAVPISETTHAALMVGLSAGLGLGVDENGQPVLIEQVIPELTGEDVDRERRSRIASGFMFGGKHYQSDPTSLADIAGAATAAVDAKAEGAAAGDLRWFLPDVDFGWIATDNTFNPMDAQTMVLFGKTAMAHKSAHIFKGRIIKSLSPIPTDFADDSYWL